MVKVKAYTIPQLIMAEQQICGWFHAHCGGNIQSLIDSMGLTTEEWQKLTESEMVDYLPVELRDEITAHLSGEENEVANS